MAEEPSYIFLIIFSYYFLLFVLNSEAVWLWSHITPTAAPVVFIARTTTSLWSQREAVVYWLRFLPEVASHPALDSALPSSTLCCHAIITAGAFCFYLLLLWTRRLIFVFETYLQVNYIAGRAGDSNSRPRPSRFEDFFSICAPLKTLLIQINISGTAVSTFLLYRQFTTCPDSLLPVHSVGIGLTMPTPFDSRFYYRFYSMGFSITWEQTTSTCW